MDNGQTIKSARPKRLRNGEWGAAVEGEAAPGDRLNITAKSGRSWGAVVRRVFWQGDGLSIVSTEDRGANGSPFAGDR